MPTGRFLIFDLDGVVTSEQIYWDTAATAVAEILGFGAGTDSDALPLEFVAHVKSRAVNSNWDLAYLRVCADVLSQAPAAWDALPKPLPDADAAVDCEADRYSFADVARAVRERPRPTSADLVSNLKACSDATGFDLLRAAGEAVERALPFRDGRFAYGGAQYRQVHALCQRVHDDKALSTAASAREASVVDVTALAGMLDEVARAWGAEFGVATGRMKAEALRALTQFGIADRFPPSRIVCYDDIIRVEEGLSEEGTPIGLAKPHPFSLLRARFPDIPLRQLLEQPQRRLPGTAYVCDGVGDIMAAKAAGMASIGVLTGIPDVGGLRAERRHGLLTMGADVVVPTVIDLPEALRSLSDWPPT